MSGAVDKLFIEMILTPYKTTSMMTTDDVSFEVLCCEIKVLILTTVGLLLYEYQVLLCTVRVAMNEQAREKKKRYLW